MSTKQMAKTTKTAIKRLKLGGLGRLAVALLFAVALLVPQSAYAAQLTSRSITLGSSAPSASTTHDFDFTTATTANIGSIKYEYCDTPSGACSSPSGMDVDSVSISAQTGATGFSIDASGTDAGQIVVTRTPASLAASTAVSHTFSTAVNPSATNTTFYIRITTYTSTDATTGSTDTGTVAASTATQIDVSATVDETLTFCTGTSGITSSSCAGATGSSVSLGTLSTSTTGTGTSQIGVTTNATSGYSITINGTTLTSGGNTITALATQTASSQGSEQFGVNLVANTTPSVGSNPAGSGTATPTANYGTADQFRFVTGDSIASKNASDAFRLFTVSYIANIAGSTEPGTYNATMTYICTATF